MHIAAGVIYRTVAPANIVAALTQNSEASLRAAAGESY